MDRPNNSYTYFISEKWCSGLNTFVELNRLPQECKTKFYVVIQPNGWK